MEAGQSPTRITATVKGRVQGVGFRYYTRQRARSLNLKGWVRNSYDGSVQLVAEGPRRDVEALLDAVRIGPSTSRVDDVEVEWSTPTGEYEDFTVR
jgi:acylphosphatase